MLNSSEKSSANSSANRADATKRKKRKPKSHWQATRQLTLALFFIWFAVTFGVLFFARDLDNIQFFYWPLSLYMAAQGLTLGFVLLLGVYSLVMRRIEARHRNNAP